MVITPCSPAPDRTSVLLPYRNAAATLREAATSVLADLGADDELVMIDDGSSDASAQIAAGLEDRRVVHVSTAGVGIAGALGRGLTASRGGWIARMDADDVSLPGRFAAQRALLATDEGLAAVATQVDVFGEAGDGIRRFVAWQNALVTPADHARSIFVESPVCHPSTMLRRSALEAVGGFRAIAAEDYDLWLRLDAAGFKIAKVPEVLFHWRIHATNATWSVSFDALRALRARHLALRVDRPFAIWGAGAAGRRLARELELHDRRARFFLDIDPKKIGSVRRGVPILDVPSGLARLRSERAFLVVAVAAHGARDLVRGRLFAAGFRELADYVCAA